MELTPKRIVRKATKRSRKVKHRPKILPSPVEKSSIKTQKNDSNSLHMNLKEKIDFWVSEAFFEMNAPELAEKIPWHWNSRITRVMGKARAKFVFGEIKPDYMEFSISLFGSANDIQRRQTVFHECAHIVDFYRGTYKSKQAHGKSWQRIMVNAGVPAKRCHNVSSSQAAKNKFPAKCLCKTHMITKKMRNKILKGQKCRCKRCNSVVTLIKANRTI